MSDMMISDLQAATALGATDKLEIEQVGQLESTHVTIALLLSHINTQLLTSVKADIDALEVSIGGSGVSLSVVEGRVTATEADITALETALANEITARGNADTAISASITTFSTNLATEVTNRTNADNALDARLDTVEDNVNGLTISVGNKAALVHTHVIADVTGLAAALAGKEPANANIQAHITATNNPHGTTKFQVGLGNVDNTSDANKPVSTAQQNALDAKANTTHTHVIADTTGLQTALNGKAATVHTHVVSDVTGLQTALDNKAGVTHTHIISEVTGLQTALNAQDAAIQDVADDLTNEAIARAAIGAEVVAARGAFVDLDARLDNLAVSAGAVTSVFGRSGDVTAAEGDYDFADLGTTPTTLAGYGITDAAALTHVHSAADITSGVLGVARGGTGGLGFQYIISETKPTGVPVGTRWLDSTNGREYTLHQDIDETLWVQWSGGQPIQGTDPMGLISESVWGNVTGTLADQLDLQAALDAKAAVAHTHAISAVTGLQAALDGKAASSHTHIVADVTGLQAALDAKAAITGQAFSGAVSATTLSDSSGNVRNLLPVTANATTTLDSTHINKVVEKTNTTAYTYTISPSLGVQGDVITIINSGTAGDITVARGTGVALYRATTDGSITVAPGTMATLYRTGTSNRWMA
jgi:hypothetical protein